MVYKAPRRFLRLRELARVYGLLSRDLARSKNRIKSLARRRGIDCAELRGRWLKQLPAGLRPVGELLGV